MNIDVIRAWKDRDYRESLSAEEQALLPDNPVGEINLSDDELHQVHGAAGGSNDSSCHSFNWCSHQSYNWCRRYSWHTWCHDHSSWHSGCYSWHHSGCHWSS